MYFIIFMCQKFTEVRSVLFYDEDAATSRHDKLFIQQQTIVERIHVSAAVRAARLLRLLFAADPTNDFSVCGADTRTRKAV